MNSANHNLARDIIIYGAGNVGRTLLKLLKNKYHETVKVTGFLDKNKTGFLDGEVPILDLEHINRKGIIIIALYDLDLAMQVYEELRQFGFRDVYWFKKVQQYCKGDFFTVQCFDCSKWDGVVLPKVEMHIMDSCNLNCRGCAHFSPIFQNEIPNFNERIEDVKLLQRKFDFIKHFFILGGEPFLNPEIGKYAIEIRKILKFSYITIVSNGLLIPSADKSVLSDIQKSDITISISEYEPTHRIIKTIKKKLDAFNIRWGIRPYHEKKDFALPLTDKIDNSITRGCLGDGCIIIWNGWISRCPQLMYINKLNEVFHTDYPAEGRLLLDSPVHGKELLRVLEKEVPLCAYCVSEKIRWERIIGIPKVDDFVALGD